PSSAITESLHKLLMQGVENKLNSTDHSHSHPHHHGTGFIERLAQRTEEKPQDNTPHEINTTNKVIHNENKPDENKSDEINPEEIEPPQQYSCNYIIC